VKHVIPANGTDALQIAMMGLDLKPGDEVITADFTFADCGSDCFIATDSRFS
jgi:dTDP-4-amino-4,6-dideoxygalactose transaminase